MSKILINKTESAIYACGKLLIPGTNVVEEDIDVEASDLKPFIDGGSIAVKDPEKVSEADKKEIVDNITNRATVKSVKKAVKNINTEAAEKKIDAFEEQLKKAQ